MASIRRKKGTPNWYACVTLPGGRRRQFSTRKTNRKEALEIAQATELALRKGRDRQHFLHLLGGLWAEVSPEGPKMLAADYFARWFAVRKPEISKTTAEKYAQVIDEASAAWEGRDLDQLSQQDVAALRDQWGSVHSAATANLKLRILKGVLADAWRDGAAARNEAAKVRPLKKSASKSRRPFSTEELRLLLQTAGETEWKGMILLGLYTGQRLKDLANLSWDKIHLDRQEISFRAGKTGRIILLPLACPLADYLIGRPAPDQADEALFPALAGLRSAALSQAFYRLMTEARLVTPREHWKGRRSEMPKRRTASVIGFHSLRHTATSMLKAAGVSEAVAMAIIGHDSPAVSQHYTSIGQETLREAISRLPRLDSKQPE
jgi:integrase